EPAPMSTIRIYDLLDATDVSWVRSIVRRASRRRGPGPTQRARERCRDMVGLGKMHAAGRCWCRCAGSLNLDCDRYQSSVVRAVTSPHRPAFRLRRSAKPWARSSMAEQLTLNQRVEGSSP